jgi:hypothetical protein
MCVCGWVDGCIGDFASLIISYLRLGPLRFVTLPGEFSPELVIGVPRDFDTPEGTAKYFKRPDLHPVGPDFTLPGKAERKRGVQVLAYPPRRHER